MLLNKILWMQINHSLKKVLNGPNPTSDQGRPSSPKGLQASTAGETPGYLQSSLVSWST